MGGQILKKTQDPAKNSGGDPEWLALIKTRKKYPTVIGSGYLYKTC